MSRASIWATKAPVCARDDHKLCTGKWRHDTGTRIRCTCDCHLPIAARLPTLGGEPATASHGHVGWPVDLDDVLWRTAKGLPTYQPTDPRSIDQAPFLRFAAERGPNSGS